MFEVTGPQRLTNTPIFGRVAEASIYLMGSNIYTQYGQQNFATTKILRSIVTESFASLAVESINIFRVIYVSDLEK
jgi:hypothetical protein